MEVNLLNTMFKVLNCGSIRVIAAFLNIAGNCEQMQPKAALYSRTLHKPCCCSFTDCFLKP